MKKFILSCIIVFSLILLWNGNNGVKEVKAASDSYICTSNIKIGEVEYAYQCRNRPYEFDGFV